MINFRASKYTKHTEANIVKKPKKGQLHKIMVYGTLRKGCGNDGLLKDATFVSEQKLPGFEMYSNGGFPYCIKVPDNTCKITTELYLVTDDELRSLDGLEGVSCQHYSRVAVDRPGYADSEIYVPHNETRVKHLEKVHSGDWKDVSGRRYRGRGSYEDDMYRRNSYS